MPFRCAADSTALGRNEPDDVRREDELRREPP
jgi:hypothetical protein